MYGHDQNRSDKRPYSTVSCPDIWLVRRNKSINDIYFRAVHVVIFILFKPTHALFLKHIHIHIHIQNSKLLKMF